MAIMHNRTFKEWYDEECNSYMHACTCFIDPDQCLFFSPFSSQVQLNLMAPTRDNYYGNQQTIQGLVSHFIMKITNKGVIIFSVFDMGSNNYLSCSKI